MNSHGIAGKGLKILARYPMTEIIAQREFDFVGFSGQVAVVASLGKPSLMPDVPNPDWYCPYVIQGPHRRREFFAAGVDAFQALLLALTAVRTDLELMKREGKLTWLDSDDLGIALLQPHGGAA